MQPQAVKREKDDSQVKHSPEKSKKDVPLEDHEASTQDVEEHGSDWVPVVPNN